MSAKFQYLQPTVLPTHRTGSRRWRTLSRKHPGSKTAGEADAGSRETLPVSKVRPSEQGLQISTTRDGRGTVVAPAGELDGASVADLEQALADAISIGRPIEIDLRAATFIDSSGLWAITLAHGTCRERGIPLRLRPGPRRVQQVFEVTGLYDVLPFLTDEPGAS